MTKIPLSIVAFAVVVIASPLQAQTASTRKPAAGSPAPTVAKKFVPKRTPWGDPDISGNFSTKSEMNTPMERPDEFAGRRIEDVSPQELAAIVAIRQQRAVEGAPFLGGGSRTHGVALGVPIHWLDHLDAVNSRPWLVIDPPDGKIPPQTDEARKRQSEQAAARQGRGTADSFTDRSYSDRCISFGTPQMTAGLYGASFQILQTKDYVAIRYEMIHETRIIPIEGRGAARPHNSPALRTYYGDATARWEGDTLVVDTTNLNGRINVFSAYRVASARLHLVERFTRTAPRTVTLATTVEDASTWARPWTYELPLTEDDSQPIFEYACHEGNYGLRNILSAGRSDDRKGIKSSDSVDAQGDLKGEFEQ